MSETGQKTEQKPESTGNLQEGRNPDGTFKKGFSGNPAGRQEGSENFATKWRKFIEKIAEKNGITPEEVDEQLYVTAFNQAKKGKYLFFKDIQDRLHGKAVQPIQAKIDGELQVEIKKINYIVPEAPKQTDETGNGNQSNTNPQTA